MDRFTYPTLTHQPKFQSLASTSLVCAAVHVVLFPVYLGASPRLCQDSILHQLNLYSVIHHRSSSSSDKRSSTTTSTTTTNTTNDDDDDKKRRKKLLDLLFFFFFFNK